jgi:hypothetical protein
MKILLINNNPVVSRLTALSARKEDIEIDEIQEVTELSSDTYDIVFVDADSWTKDVKDVIAENIKTQKSVLFYADGDEEEKASFDLSILKPFLPSEVSAVIRSIEEATATEEASVNDINHFDIIADAKESNRDELFTLDGLDDIEEKKEEPLFTLEDELKDETVALSFDDRLEEAFPLKTNALDDEPKVELDIYEEITPKEIIESKNNDIDNDLFDLDLSDEIPSLDDDLFAENKKEDILGVKDEVEFDDVLEVKNELRDDSTLLSLDEELSLEIDEPALEEVKIETQVLDALEIENIKGILTEDISDDMTLEDLMPPVIATPSVEETSKSFEANDVLDIDSKEVVQTLATMPIEGLRELLAGAKVNIKIKFPKSKK